jgi:hypothetical protein
MPDNFAPSSVWREHRPQDLVNNICVSKSSFHIVMISKLLPNSRLPLPLPRFPASGEIQRMRNNIHAELGICKINDWGADIGTVGCGISPGNNNRFLRSQILFLHDRHQVGRI